MDATYRDILKYYWPHIWAYKWSASGGLIGFVLGGVLANSVLPLVYRQIIDTVTLGANANSAHFLAISIGLLTLVTVGYMICFRIADYLHAYAQSNILKHLADETFTRIGEHSQAFFADTFVGSLVAKAQRYVRSFEDLHDTFVFNIVTNVAILCSTLAILFWLAPILAFIFMCWFGVYVLITTWMLKRKIPLDVAKAAAQSTTTGALADAITNMMTVKMFARFSAEQLRLGKITSDLERKRRRAWNWDNFQRFVQNIAVATLIISVMAVAVSLWLKGEVSAGTIVLVQIYLVSLSDITHNLGRQIARTVQSLNDAKEMIAVFKAPASVQDPKEPITGRITKGNVVFNNVSFSYASERMIFKNLSLTIPAGQKVGLVGHSGAGKTTITKLLLRFADVTNGEITIDGYNIADMTQDNVRKYVSYVPQEPVLFHRSLKENIAYGNPRATKAEIIAAAKKAHAHEFIQTLKDGYDTLVGERGVKLSGGERQRVAIARALLKDAPVLVLDEATSSLDSISERYIQDALKKLMEGRTTLVVAHRLSTIQNMDRILVFSKGRIIEDGSHSELIANKDGVYYELWKEQSSGFIQD